MLLQCSHTLIAVVFDFFFNDTATTEIYTLSLHDALPISGGTDHPRNSDPQFQNRPAGHQRSEEHTSELQSRQYLVCRLLLEKNKSAEQSSSAAASSSAPPMTSARKSSGWNMNRNVFFFNNRATTDIHPLPPPDTLRI